MTPWQTCGVCGSAPARVCRGCVRTIADRDFAAIGRTWRREGGCVVCESGSTHYCGTCAIAEIDDARRTT